MMSLAAGFMLVAAVVQVGPFTGVVSGTSSLIDEPREVVIRTQADWQAFWKTHNGKQSGDPAKLARALITIASEAVPPRRFIAGADAIATAQQKVTQLQAEIDAFRGLSSSLAFDTEGGL